jgi:hypothetical protein
VRISDSDFLALTYTQLPQYSYLPSPPYHDNAALHTYAGLLCLRLALFTDANLSRDARPGGKWKPSKIRGICLKSAPRDEGEGTDASRDALLREAQQHLERAHALDQEGVIAQMFIHKVR